MPGDILSASLVDPAANMLLRQTLLQTAPKQSVKVGTYTATKGQTTRVRLQNIGLVTHLRLFISAAVTIATDALTASKKSPWSLIDTIRVTDFSNTDRVNISGFHLWLLNCIRSRTISFYNNEAKSAVATPPSVSTAIGAGTVQLYVEVPLAYDSNRDLRGAVHAQVGTGEWYLIVTWNSAFLVDGDVDSVYSADGSSGTCTEGTITMTVFQDFLQPQPLQQSFNGLPAGLTPLPMRDMMTVYEINGKNRQTDNLANGSEKTMNIPNWRELLSFTMSFINNKALSNAVDNFRLIANGNTTVYADTLETRQMAMRNWLNGDTVDGVFFWQWRDTPLVTSMYGSMQMGFTPNASLTSPYVEYTTEAFIQQGQVLPAVNAN